MARVAGEGADQGGAVGVGVDPGDERAVELQVVGQHLGDLAQAGVAGADVVDREPGAARAQPSPIAPRTSGSLPTRRLLGDLDDQPVEAVAAVAGEVVEQLAGRLVRAAPGSRG